MRLLHHADHRRVAVRIAAVRAQLAVADVVADAAEAELVLDVEQRLRQVLGIVAAGAQHVKREPLRGLLPDAGQTLELVDQPRERFGEIGHRLEQARRQAHAAQHAAHLLLDLRVDLLDGFVAGGQDHVLQHLDVARHFRDRSSRRARSSGRPSCTVTMPPPAEASTRISAISSCIFSCICCACCIICCMLPGSFTCLLLQVANCANLAAEDFPETLHFRIGQRAAGGFVLGVGLGRRGMLIGAGPAATSPVVILMRSGRPKTSRTASSKPRSLK